MSNILSHRFCYSLVILWAVASAGRAAQPYESFGGRAMGTTYAVKIAGLPASVELKAIASDVQHELERLEQIFSLFRADSELSRLNAAVPNTWVEVSSDLHTVARRALQLSQQTGGAFDPTVGPLVRLWRVQDLSPAWSPPAANAIDLAKQRVGARLIEIRDSPPAIRKLAAGVELDLNALVEGWALDQLIAQLRTRGCHDVLLELGGEFRGSGQRGDGQPWRVGIEDPTQSANCYVTVALENRALATSGDYRNQRIHKDRRYSHILDPRTGAPIEHDVTAVSVLAADGLTADGWSTALMVLGPTVGCELAEREGLTASFVLRTPGTAEPILTGSAKQRFIRRAR